MTGTVCIFKFYVFISKQLSDCSEVNQDDTIVFIKELINLSKGIGSRENMGEVTWPWQ